jgi:anti-anti-sigma factor
MNMAEPADTDELVVRRVDSATEVLLDFIGELDLAGVDRVNEATRHLPQHGHVTVDLSQLTFMDSTGVRLLMNLDLRSRAEQWTLTLRAPQPQVLNMFKLCGFENRFEISQ